MPNPATTNTLIAVIAAVVSAAFGIVAWLAKREIAKKDKEIQVLQEDVGNLLKLVPVMESFEKSLERESSERTKIEDQQWSKINTNWSTISDLRTTLSGQEGICQRRFMTQEEFARLERLRERMEQQKATQDERLNQNVQVLIQMLRSPERKNGRT